MTADLATIRCERAKGRMAMKAAPDGRVDVLLLSALAAPAGAQELDFAALRGAAAAIGGLNVERIEFTGVGFEACLGQAWKSSTSR